MPNRPLKPDQLGKVVASRIASEPAKQRLSLRNSVLVGRIATGLALAVLILGLSIPVFAAISWLQGLLETDANAVENPLAGDEGGAFSDLTDFLASALGLGDAASPPLLGDGDLEPGETPAASGADSTTSTAGGNDSTSTTFGDTSTSTTLPTGSTSSSTSSSTTSTTVGSTTSTTVGTTTTTIVGSTTTTTVPTTTTTSSCGNQSGNGNGKGRGNC